MSRDYYDLLGVSRQADGSQIKSAFRKLAMEHHPDRNGGCEDASSRFKELNEAYSVLSDPDKRAAYDRFGHAGVNGMGGAGGFGGGAGAGFQNVNDIFSEVFGDVFGEMFNQGRRSSGPVRGADLRHDLEISLEQAYRGAEVEIVTPSTVTCDTCDGSGAKPGTSPTVCGGCGGAGRVRAANGFFAVERTCPRCGGAGRVVNDPCVKCHGHGQVRKERKLQVRIPAGVDDGARIRLAGEGDSGFRGGPRGDLYIFLSVKPHELFERDGLDLLCSVPVPMCTAALGGEIEAPCLSLGDGAGDTRVEVKVPEGAQTGRSVRIKGRGMPSLNGRQRGDLVVDLFVETPTNLTAAQKKLLLELSGLCGEKQHPKHAGFFNKARRFWTGITGQPEGETA
ncbi:MAG TPA: molecular chaperone DnaJ [Caulobacteraceae bacterium]|jgi:molecular chaperone DnaJ